MGIAPDPFSILGSTDWTDYSVSVDARLEGPGTVALMGRIDSADVFLDGQARWPSGYILTVMNDGSWELNSSKHKTPARRLAAGKVVYSAKTWNHLALSFKGTGVQAAVDGVSLATVNGEARKAGMVGVGSGWNRLQFDNFSVNQQGWGGCCRSPIFRRTQFQ